MSGPGRAPGWDAQAISEVVGAHYGQMIDLFEAHGWPERGAAMMPARGKRIAAAYGGIEAFVAAHERGLAGNALLNPLAAIEADPPDVWLTSYYGFAPEEWGLLGFAEDYMRRRFLNQSRPGALVVIYGASGAPRHQRLKVLGIQQQSHRIGSKWDFLPPERAAQERANTERWNKWGYAVQVVRAWRIPEESQPTVSEMFPQTYTGRNGMVIGSQGLKVTATEARRILNLDLIETSVWGGADIEASVPGAARAVLAPSRPGPVSQAAYVVREAEGPKHLYILKLEGPADHMLGEAVGDKLIVKVGFSHSPSTRRDAHNKALPECAFRWQVEYSTAASGRTPFPTSGHAKAGEQAMKDRLEFIGRSLGGEFFLADRKALDRAWQEAIATAEGWKP
jgi:hypothetical protein